MKVYAIMADGITEEPIIVKDVKDAEKIHSFLTHLYNEKNDTEYFTFAEREENDYEVIFDPNKTFEEWGLGCDAIFLEVIENYQPKDEE